MTLEHIPSLHMTLVRRKIVLEYVFTAIIISNLSKEFSSNSIDISIFGEAMGILVTVNYRLFVLPNGDNVNHYEIEITLIP